MTRPTGLDHRAAIEGALRRLDERAESPRALAVRPEDRAALRQAIDRVAARLLGEDGSVLTIALAGCTGAGKSTLINALAGGRIAESSEQRPCTMRTRVYHHRDVPVGGLPPELARQATFVAHDRPELRLKVIVDTPDLDSFATENREATRALLKAAGLVIYVFSPEKYWEERVWSVIREEERFSACLAVMNKADLVPAAELRKAADEVRRRFAEMGHDTIPVFPIHATAHVPRPDGSPPATPTGALDEFENLRAHIEHEIHEGEIAQLLRKQRARTVENLAEIIDRLAPPDFPARLDDLARTAEIRASDAAERLADLLDDRLGAVETELKPLAAIRRHQRFFGPFRLWLALLDFATYGLPRLVRKLRMLGGPEGETDLEAMLAAGRIEATDDLLRAEARELQNACFALGLPVGPWATIATGASGSRLLAEIAREIESRFDALTAARSGQRRDLVTWSASAIGALIPMAMAAYAILVLLRRLANGRIEGGLAILGMVLALTVLAYILLHGLVGLMLSTRQTISGRDVGALAVQARLRRALSAWVRSYRGDLECDLADFRDPLRTLRAAVEPPRAEPSRPTTFPGPVARPVVPPATVESLTGPVMEGPSATGPPRREPATPGPPTVPEPEPLPEAPGPSPAEALRAALKREGRTS